MRTTWQIWQSKNGGETGTFPANSPHHDLLSHDTDGQPMELIHEFLVEGEPDDIEHVERAFAYSKKYQFDEGEWPAGAVEKPQH